jgi:excisionase family DNA binding protein
VTDKWLTVREVAEYLKLSTDLVYKFAQQGKIPVSRIGNQWRFDREEIDAWVKSQRPKTRANLPAPSKARQAGNRKVKA